MIFNQTKPLPFDNSTNTQIYNPFMEDGKECPYPNKKSKLHNHPSSTSLSAFLNKSTHRHNSSKRRSLSIHTHISKSSNNFTFPKSDQFSFNNNNSSFSTSSSDLESLPDLTDDDDLTPETTPIKKLQSTDFQYLEKPRFKLKIQEHKVSIFDVPEIVHKILTFVDDKYTNLPIETNQIRRKPINYNHALLIHGDAKLAKRALEDEGESSKKEVNPLFNCLLVNKLFYRITSDIISKKFYINNEFNLLQFIQNQGLKTIQFQPKIFILHKLFQTKHKLFEQAISLITFSQLEWFELYMCPKIKPNIEIFQQAGSRLKKLIITGSKSIDDSFLIKVSQYCKNLEILDLRACEYITDFAIYHISINLKKLKVLNLGRKNRGRLISDVSIIQLINSNLKLNTIGLAGCNITSKTLFEIALKLPNIERLSLNDCKNLTEDCFTLLIDSHNQSFFNKLKVLELRFNLQLENMKPLIQFKKRQEFKNQIVLLLELCEDLMIKYRQQEVELEKAVSMKIFNDITSFINDINDGDMDYRTIITNR